VHPAQVAPHTEAANVVVFVTSARRAELEVTGRDIPAAAHRAHAAEAIPHVDVGVRDVGGEPMAPGVPHG
jgi:hypothetical protein